MRFALCFLLAVISVANAVDEESYSLAYVTAIWRHGDRAPETLPYPNDKYTEDYWPRGYGELTSEGMVMLHELGSFFRKEYVPNFVNETYNYDAIYVRSTDANRALVSAQAFLNGFYPPVGHAVWKEGLNWQPIAVHGNSPGTPDPLLRPTDLVCDAYDKHWKKVKKEVYETLQTKYGDVLQVLAENTGYGNAMSVHQATKLIDITREVAHNLSQPAWVTKTWPNHDNNSTLDIITELYRYRRMAQFTDDKLNHLRGGFLLNNILEQIHNVTKGVQGSRKMVLYSSHDGTLLSLLYAMNVADGQLIPYAAAIIFEVLQNENGYHVQIKYRYKGNIKIVQIPGCTQPCPAKSFIALLAPKAIKSEKDLKDDCSDKFLRGQLIGGYNSSSGKSLFVAMLMTIGFYFL
uniref:Acid phosphatase n=1 Tax=Panagrellus redivivus TaxID=6233 RepID=A0A7E4VM26_PANRE